MKKVVEKKYPQKRGALLLQKASVPKLSLLQGRVCYLLIQEEQSLHFHVKVLQVKNKEINGRNKRAAAP